jgi:TfoX/Sxy family transcriptional regulator of competence genes
MLPPLGRSSAEAYPARDLASSRLRRVSRAPKKGSFPKPDAETRAAFEALVPEDPRVAIRPMFGNLSAFVNGNMFMGVFGRDLFVRLPDDDSDRLIGEGGSDFEPMPGRAMKGYVALPEGWREDRSGAAAWIERSLEWVAEMPPKESKKAKRRS